MIFWKRKTAVPEPALEQAPPPEGAAGFFRRLRDGLKKSSTRLAEGVATVFTHRRLDETSLEALEELLILSDMGATASARITRALAKDRFDKSASPDDIRAALAEEITEILKPREKTVDFAEGPRPRIVLFVGVNGSGKTTTIGKIAHRLSQDGARVALAAGDTFRAAATEQLKVWAQRSGAVFFSRETGADAAALAFEAIEGARREQCDVLLIDTAGRLQNRVELMAELAKTVRAIRKAEPSGPHDVILVLDATVGQNALQQLEAFRQTAGVTGLIMTKLDGTAKGGVLVAIAERYDVPIHFTGVGEQAEDLQPFRAQSFARALVGLDP
jgi:fused signal recognition particle receptor